MLPRIIAIANEPITRPSVHAIWNGSSPERSSASVVAPTASGPGNSRDCASAAVTAQAATSTASERNLDNAYSPPEPG